MAFKAVAPLLLEFVFDFFTIKMYICSINIVLKWHYGLNVRSDMKE